MLGLALLAEAHMATILVRDAVNARASEPVLSWSWDKLKSCTVAMLIEERVRAECDRVASGARSSELLSELSFDLDWMTDKIVDRALAAFARGKIFIIVNDRQVTALDEEIPIEETTETVFLKLVQLKGG
jgi:hypothetical protein